MIIQDTARKLLELAKKATNGNWYAFQAGADYALTSSNSEQQLLVEKLNAEVTRLKRIIAKELAQAQAEVKRLHDIKALESSEDNK